MERKVLLFGDRGLLLEYEALPKVLADYAVLEKLLLANHPELQDIADLVPASRTMLVKFQTVFPAEKQQRERATRLLELLSAAESVYTQFEPQGRSESQRVPQDHPNLQGVSPGEHQPQLLTLDVIYDGADLTALATTLGISVQEVINRHTADIWTAAFAGFAPGFVYCVGTGLLGQVPRLDSPRTRVPRGAVAVAAEFSAVYPHESPGGWQLLGQTTATIWDEAREQPALVRPGMQIRYRAAREAVTAAPVQAPENTLQAAEGATHRTASTSQASESTAQALQTGEIEVVQPGVQLLVQDAGRPGNAKLGVGVSGAADLRLLQLANRAVGNPENTPALECAIGLTQLRFHAPATIAWAGADVCQLRTATGELRPVIPGAATQIEPGSALEIGLLTRGVRGYLAVAGGLNVPQVLGSSATDVLAQLGPRQLRAGEHIALGAQQSECTKTVLGADPQTMPELPAPGASVTVRVQLAPRTAWFTEQSVANFLAAEWLVSPASDRVGVRLQGEVPLARISERELPSEGMRHGAIQVPPNGQPVVFLPDHPVTGGYPVIATVVSADLPLLGQLGAGMRVRFTQAQEPSSEISECA